VTNEISVSNNSAFLFDAVNVKFNYIVDRH